MEEALMKRVMPHSQEAEQSGYRRHDHEQRRHCGSFRDHYRSGLLSAAVRRCV